MIAPPGQPRWGHGYNGFRSRLFGVIWRNAVPVQAEVLGREEIPESMRAFAYHAPKSLSEAVAVLQREGAGGRVLAGGTDLLVQAKERGVVPAYVVSLKDVAELAEITYDRSVGLFIGARVPLAVVAHSTDVRPQYSALASGASLVGSHQIQNRGTVGGNICNAAPSADTAPPLLVFEAIVAVHGPHGARDIPIDEFFVGPGATALAPGEVLVGISLPPPDLHAGSAYERHTPRQEMDIAVAGVAARVVLSSDGRITNLRIALGAVGPTPFRAKSAESRATGQLPDDNTIREVAELAANEARPISDQRGSATYRRRLVEVLTRRTVSAAIAQARDV